MDILDSYGLSLCTGQKLLVYPNHFKIWFWAISKLPLFVDLNRLNINNIEPVKIGKFRCFEAAENPNLGAPRGVHSLADERSVRKPLIKRVLYRVLNSGGDKMS